MTPAENRARIFSDASRRLDRLARRVDHEWPTLRYRMTAHPQAIAHGQGTPPPGFTLDPSSARAQALGDAAMLYASAAARQHALPYWTHADARAEARTEHRSFTEAMRLGPMTDWTQARGQSAEARTRAALTRIKTYRVSIENRCARGEFGQPWHGEIIAA